MDSDGQIYLGIWTNWSRGSAIMGATLTTTRNSGNILIAFTAIFIPFVASRLWKMLCLAFHFCYSKRGAQDAIYHQRQVILRNSSSTDSGLVSLLFLTWAWRRPVSKTLARLSPIVIFAALFIVGFTIAGGYSSQITSVAGDEVLIKGDNCGIFVGAQVGSVNFTSSLAIDAWSSSKWAGAANYAQQCYADQGDDMLDCSTLVTRSISTTSDGNAGCPFPSDICRDNATNLRLDTGYIDSNDHLGLNAPPSQRFLWRQVLSCAPLRTDGYTSSHVTNNRTFVRYHYGDQPTGSSDNLTMLNYTYTVPDLQSQYTQTEGSPTGLNFRVKAGISIAVNGTVEEPSNFIADSTLGNPDGHIVIVFLSGNGVPFLQKSDDAWYRATRLGTKLKTTDASGSGDSYLPSEAASPLGCVQQYQWCNSEYPVPDGCGPLAGFMDAAAGAFPLFNLTMEDFEPARPSSSTERGSRIIWPLLTEVIAPLGIGDVVGEFGANALASQTLMEVGVQLAVAENQWQLDVTKWWNTMLAFQQALLVTTALGNTDANLQPYISPPLNDQERHLCRSQKIRNTGYASFSLFGLLFTYILGVLIVLASFVLDPIMRCLHKWKNYKQYEYLEWRANDALQLHRLAQDELGYGKWSNCTDTVPVTRPGDLLAGLDIGDLEHPRLDRNFAEETKPEASSHTETAVNHETSAESSEDTIRNADTEQPLSKSQVISQAEDISISPIDERESVGAQRVVSMVSIEEVGRVQMDLDEAATGNAQGMNE